MTQGLLDLTVSKEIRGQLDLMASRVTLEPQVQTDSKEILERLVKVVRQVTRARRDSRAIRVPQELEGSKVILEPLVRMVRQVTLVRLVKMD